MYKRTVEGWVEYEIHLNRSQTTINIRYDILHVKTCSSAGGSNYLKYR